MPGPLAGVRIVELAAIGPVPFAGMVLADFGAEVVRIDRLENVDVGLPVQLAPAFDVMARGRRSLAIDLKSTAGRDALMRLVDRADVLIEGFRPGVMERLGVGPEACLATNPRLVYGQRAIHAGCRCRQTVPCPCRQAHAVLGVRLAQDPHGAQADDRKHLALDAQDEATWVRPELSAAIQYRALTSDGPPSPRVLQGTAPE
jgi:hypothetical protein